MKDAPSTMGSVTLREELMTLALRRTVFADGERRPDDYEVRYDGRTVGRIYRMRISAGRELWRLTTERDIPTVARPQRRRGR
jgi:hypothetical protein